MQQSTGISRWQWQEILSPKGWFWALVSLALSAVSAYFLLRPQIAVDPDISPNPKDASATFFRFTNQGVLSVYDFKRSLSINYLRNPAHSNKMENVRIINSSPVIKELSSGESTTLNIPTGEEIFRPASGHTQYTEADVKIDYFYKDFCSFRHTKSVRFQAILGSDEIVHWFHKAISE